MKVLISAIACNPYLGSESHFGSSAIKTLAREHELFVITTSRDRADLERAAAAGLVPANVRYFYAGKVSPWHPNRMRARLQSWGEYIQFTRDSFLVAQALHRQENFDLVHHLTYATWRIASPMWQLGIPFVLGPIGGYEQFPFRIFPTLSAAGAAFELLRKTSNVVSRCSPAVRRSLRAADRVIASTIETEQLVTTLRGSGENISRLSPGFYTAANVAAYARFVPGKKIDGRLRIFASGHLGGHKGIALALAALVRVKQQGVDFCYHLGADGPELSHLKKLTAKLGLTREVMFGREGMRREDYQQELGDTHIYLLPSLRESVGLTMMEAMLAGAVPVVADCGGPNFIVTNECGYKIPVTTPSRMAVEIADVILALHRDRQLILQKGRLASERIASHFTEENYHQTINAVYASAVGGSPRVISAIH